jgi:hypothetical protein
MRQAVAKRTAGCRRYDHREDDRGDGTAIPIGRSPSRFRRWPQFTFSLKTSPHRSLSRVRALSRPIASSYSSSAATGVGGLLLLGRQHLSEDARKAIVEPGYAALAAAVAEAQPLEGRAPAPLLPQPRLECPSAVAAELSGDSAEHVIRSAGVGAGARLVRGRLSIGGLRRLGADARGVEPLGIP